MGCVTQKQCPIQKQNKFRFHSQSFSNAHQNKKVIVESSNPTNNNNPILHYRSIDITNDEEFILKRDKKYIASDKESPTTTPKFNQSNPTGIGQRKNVKVM
ncbi:unnamed protein product [Paramecium octaurelia]|uniref:Uncharacterized protein n=1 Tax=Paramecium octaurelia TaxID=43137 RepID=A0A8S1V2Q0_PAROT|nr:unnamed protein product [Paramecium octaurelia]